jgi:poly(3-hydroxybutyrate) depolymerase
MPFNGGTVGEGQRGSEGGTVESAQSTLKFWATHNGCSSPSDTLLPVVANDGTRVTVRQYASCRNGVTTTLYTVSGGGHNWYPNQAGALAQKLIGLGPTSKNLDVTQTVTDFFLTQSK